MMGANALERWGNNSYYTYIRLASGFDPDNLEAKFVDFIIRHRGEDAPENTAIGLQALTDIHLTSNRDSEWRTNGSTAAVYTFSAVAFVVLLIACVNFMKFDNKTVFITGANRGIGRATVTALLDAGVRKIYAAARNTDSLPDFGDSRVVPVAVDITHPASIAAAAAGAGDVNLLINNAGAAHFGSLLETSLDDVRADMDVNYYGTLDVVRAFLPVLENNEEAAIVNVVTIAAFVNFPGIGGYSASKAALFSMNLATLVMAEDLKSIGVNVDLQAMDFGAMGARRINRAVPGEGGWDIGLTYWPGGNVSDPVGNVPMQANCDQAWPGWPCDADHQALIDAYPFATGESERQNLADRIQASAYELVPYVPIGQWFSPVAYSPRISGVLEVPGSTVLWNVDKGPYRPL